MKLTTIEDAPVKMFNVEHKNFTDSSEYIPKGTEIDGDIKIVQGLRKGEPFDYRIFCTKDQQIIFLNKTNYKKMDNNMTEVKLGADGKPSSVKTETIINLPGGKSIGKKSIIGALVGAGAGYGYCKYKKHDNKTTMYYAAGGALIGGVIGYLIENQIITIKKS